MSVLTGDEIKAEHAAGRIIINPFNPAQLNERGVSYDVTLMPKLAVFRNLGVMGALGRALGLQDKATMCIDGIDPANEQIQWLYNQIRETLLAENARGDYDNFMAIDPRCPPPLFEYDLEDCPVLVPGVLYLASTNEEAGSDFYEPIIHGKSSLARLGLSVHETAGLGEPGFKYQWTLEMTCTHPIRLHANMRIGQVVFETVKGEIKIYEGNYRKQKGPTGSRMDKYFKDGLPV